MIDPQLREERQGPVVSRVLRQFAAIWILVFAALAYFRGFAQDHTVFAWICVALIIVPGIAGILLPAIIRPVFVVATVVTWPIGWVVSHIILLVIFYVVFTPVALVFKLIGRDALTRCFRHDLESYWVAKPMPTDQRSYFRLS